MREAKFVFIVFFTLLQLVVILHSSIVTYVEQQYHNFSESQNPLIKTFSHLYQSSMLSENALFTYTDRNMAYLNDLRQSIFRFEKIPDKDSIKHTKQKKDKKPSKKATTKPKPTTKKVAQAPKTKILTENSYDTPVHTQKDESKSKILDSKDNVQEIKNEKEKATPPPIQESYTPIREINNPHISIDEGSTVLLVGDSMMQGVAPYLLKIFKKVNLYGVNLSKHSTGLTHKHYFNWANTISESFDKNPHIAIVVVLLGANDPWNMKKIPFKSELWEETYIQRIDEIITIAKSYGARVVWYEVPSVREKSLNDKIMYLNGLYEQVVKDNREYFLQSNGILTQGGKYSAFIKDSNGKSVQVRIDDGVHFTPRGYQMMANIFLNSLEVLPLDSAVQ